MIDLATAFLNWPYISSGNFHIEKRINEFKEVKTKNALIERRKKMNFVSMLKMFPWL